jgi:hypothetical protein
MNWKIATLGLGSVMVLLAAFSLSNVVMGFVGGTIHVSVPKAELRGVEMYGGIYNDGGDNALVVVQKVRSLNCPQGQTVTRTMSLAGLTRPIQASISMKTASLSDVLMDASYVRTDNGSLSGVVMYVENVPRGLTQTVENGTMYGLEADVYFVSMGSLSYENLVISIGLL